MSRVLRWNGCDVPAELAELPPGEYVIAPANDTALAGGPLVRHPDSLSSDGDAVLGGPVVVDAAHPDSRGLAAVDLADWLGDEDVPETKPGDPIEWVENVGWRSK